MSAEYQLRIIDTSGATQAVITDFLDLSYARVLNQPGLISFRLADGHPALAYIVSGNQVEVWRRNYSLGLDWGASADFIGIIRSARWTTGEITTLTVQAPGIMSLLSWRHVAYRAGTLLRSDFIDDPAETIMKSIVTYNCTSAGTTTDGRVRAATSSGKINGIYTITVQADGGGGTTTTKGCAWDNVLSALQDVQLGSGGDFDLVKTGVLSFDFRWYLGQRGTDRTSSLFFSLERGNMISPEFIDDRIDERTVAIVGGKGEAQQRSVSVVTGDDYSTSRDIETFVDATSTDDANGRTTAGREKLKIARAIPSFSFSAIQAPNAYYGLHYTLGDKVTALYRGQTFTQKVQSVSVSFDDRAGESIAVEFERV